MMVRGHLRAYSFLAVGLFLLMACGGPEADQRGTDPTTDPMESGVPALGQAEAFPRLDVESASLFAKLALHGITREYPNKLDHVMNSEEEVRSPSALHPVFFGILENCIHVPRRIDHNAFFGSFIPDQIDEIPHIAHGDLLEIKVLAIHHSNTPS